MTVSEIETRVNEVLTHIATKKCNAEKRNAVDSDSGDDEVESDDDDGTSVDHSSSSRASRGSADKADDMSFGGNENDASFDEDQSSAAADESKNNDGRVVCRMGDNQLQRDGYRCTQQQNTNIIGS